MFFSKIILALAACQAVSAHTIFTTLHVDDVDQGDGVCIRMPKAPDTCTNPLDNLSSNDMACGVDGQNGVARVCTIMQGSKLTFTFRLWADGSHPGAIDISHKGPGAVYMKKVDDATTDVGYGPGWFKIWESGYDATTKKWFTEKVMDNNGLMSVNVPADLAGGYYLVRPELLALHEADKTPSDPQFYAGCAQVFLQSSASTTPANTVSIPGYVTAGEPAVTFNIYQPKFPYPMPGPAPYVSKTASGAVFKALAAPVQSMGLPPAGCVVENANWCGIELDSYSTESGCWSASQNCYSQAETCYSTAPPTGSKNCKVWEEKCKGIENACSAGNFNGPPDKGKILTPALAAVASVPAAEKVVAPVEAVADTPAESEETLQTSYTYPAQTSTVVADPLPESTPVVADPVPEPNPVVETPAVSTGIADPVTEAPPNILTSASVVVPVPTQEPAPTSFLTSVIPTADPTTSLVPDQPLPTDTTPVPTTLPVTGDATCGATSGLTCSGSGFGNCCSQYGWCGTTDAYCVDGCQGGFGSCGSGNGGNVTVGRSRKTYPSHRYNHSQSHRNKSKGKRFLPYGAYSWRAHGSGKEVKDGQ